MLFLNINIIHLASFFPHLSFFRFLAPMKGNIFSVGFCPCETYMTVLHKKFRGILTKAVAEKEVLKKQELTTASEQQQLKNISLPQIPAFSLVLISLKI